MLCVEEVDRLQDPAVEMGSCISVVTSICSVSVCRTGHDSCPFPAHHDHHVVAMESAWDDSRPGSGDCLYPWARWQPDFLRIDHSSAGLRSLPWCNLANASVGAHLKSSHWHYRLLFWCSAEAWKSRDLHRLDFVIDIRRNHLRIFLPRTACPCSACNAL